MHMTVDLAGLIAFGLLFTFVIGLVALIGDQPPHPSSRRNHRRDR